MTLPEKFNEDGCWVPSLVAIEVGLLLPQSQILELYSTNDSLKLDVEQELSNDLPDHAIRPFPRKCATQFAASTSRIRGSVYFRDPDRAMKSFFEKLQNLETFPSEELSESAAPSPVSNELTERVCRRAEQLRQEWNVRNGNGNAV